jgi:hypothetical protein
MSEVVVQVVVDSTGAVRGARKASRAVAEVGDNGGRLNKTLGVMKGAFAALALGAVAAMFGRLAVRIFETVTAADDAASAFKTTFGGAARGLAEDLDETRRNAGLTRKELYDMAATAGAVAQGLGFTKQASADLSAEIVKAAADFQSFKNIPIEQAAHAITSALTGEREALKSLGVVVREQDVQKQALAETGKANVKQLTDEEKAAATMTLIYERMGVVAGDLDRTKDSLQNKVRRLKGSLREGATEIARRFTPALESIVDAADDVGGEFGGPFTKALGDAADAFGELVRSMDNAGVFRGVAKALLWVVEATTYTIDALSDFGSNVLIPMRRAYADILDMVPGMKDQAETQREIADESERELMNARAQRVARRALADATSEYADVTAGLDEALAGAADSTGELDTATKKAKTALQKATEQVAEYRRALAELEGPNRARLVELEKEAYELERNLRIYEKLIEAQARGVQAIDPRELNEAVHDRVMRGAAEGDLQQQAAGEQIDGVPVPELIGEYEDATLSALDRLSIAAREFQEEWGATGEALATTFGMIGQSMSALFEATGEKSRAAFLAYKAFAIGEAIAATFLAANKALASGPPPWNIAQAAAITALGIANVAKIASAQPSGSGAGTSAPSGSGRNGGRPTPGSSLPGTQRPGAGEPQTNVNVNVEVAGESRLAGDDIRTAYNKASERYSVTRG